MYRLFAITPTNVVQIEQRSVPYYANNIQSSNVTPACSDDQEIDTLKPEILSLDVMWHISDKATKYELKAYMLCGSKNDYCSKCNVYKGKPPIPQRTNGNNKKEHIPFIPVISTSFSHNFLIFWNLVLELHVLSDQREKVYLLNKKERGKSEL